MERKVSLDGFIEFAKQEYGYDISLSENVEKDTFDKIFGVAVASELNFVSTKEKGENISMSYELNDEYFLNRGYKKYDRTAFQNPDMFLYNFQKRFDDDKGKKYFIDVHKISHEWMREWDKQQPWYTPYSYTYSCQLYKKDTHAPVNMEFFSDWTIEQVEEFVERLFQNGELDYYEKWDEQ